MHPYLPQKSFVDAGAVAGAHDRLVTLTKARPTHKHSQHSHTLSLQVHAVCCPLHFLQSSLGSRIPVRNGSRRRHAAREIQGQRRHSQKRFTQKAAKTCQTMVCRTQHLPFSCFLSYFWFYQKVFYFEDTWLTDWWTDGQTDRREKIGRQSEEALLVKQGKPRTNLPKLRLPKTW